MKKLYILLLGIVISGMAYANEFPKLLSELVEVELKIGETQQLPATCKYVKSAVSDTVDVAINWIVVPDSLGTIDANFLFTAEKFGKGKLKARYNDLYVAVKLEIEGNDDDKEKDKEFPKLLLSTEKVKLTIGEIFQFPTMLNYIESAESDTINVAVNWSVEPDKLGTFDEYAVFTAEKPGKGALKASYDTVSVYIELEIEDDDDNKDFDKYPKVKIVPESIRVEVGDSVELYAFYVDSFDVKIDTMTFMWSADPFELGEFPDTENSMFFAGDNTGQGKIIARYMNLADTIKIEIYESKWKKEKKEKENNSNKGKQITIEPGDRIVYTGETPIQYSAILKTNGKKLNDAEFLWSVSDTTIATIDESGLLTLKGETGTTLVSAEASNFGASVELLVVDSMVDMECNSISIHRILPNGKELNAKTFKEGDSYIIGGLPYPLNILNGGRLHFPFDCIDEDITIYMFIPEKYAEMNDDSTEVVFSKEIITGVKFSVMPASSDTIVEPFWFNVPVELKLIYKQELLNSLGLEPQNLDVFFAENSGFVEVEPGKVATVDTARNRIYTSIEHFSTIVVREKNATTEVKIVQPISENKLDIYPNPTNSSTTVQFMMADAGDVNITVYNLLGQKVQKLVDGDYPEGLHKIRWQGTDQNGQPAPSGLYFCRFEKDGKMTYIKRIVLNR